MAYFVYILYSKKIDKYYVGETDKVESRLNSHRKGISRYTSIADDWVLVYLEYYNSRTEAIQRERAIKRMKSRKYIEDLIRCQD